MSSLSLSFIRELKQTTMYDGNGNVTKQRNVKQEHWREWQSIAGVVEQRTRMTTANFEYFHLEMNAPIVYLAWVRV